MTDDSTRGPSLEALAIGVDHLDAIVVFAHNEGTPFSSWVRRGADVDVGEIAAKADGLFSIVREADVLMVESKRAFMLVHGLRNFGVAALFAREVPLGFARMASRQIAATLEHELPFEPPPREVTPAPPRSAPAPAAVAPPAMVAAPPASPIPPPVSPVPPPVQPSRPPSAPPAVADVPAPAMVDMAPPPRVATTIGLEPSLAEPAMVRTVVRDEPTMPVATTPSAGLAPAVRPTVPSQPPLPPQVDFDAADHDEGPDTSPPRSAIGHRVRAILSHVERHAPDGHIARLRVALRSGLGLEALVYPDDLSSEALVVIETAAEDILGVEHGQLDVDGGSRELAPA